MSQPLSPSCLEQLFTRARSYDRFAGAPVSEAEIQAIWDLMKMGPTSANCLPARLVWCTSDEARGRLAQCVSSDNRAKVLSAPCTAIIGMDLAFYDQLPDLFPRADARNWFCHDARVAQATAFRNSTLQGAYFMLAARALGLDVGPMSGFDAGAVDQAFFADQPNVTVNFLVTVGRGDPEQLPPASPRPPFARFNRII